MKITIIGAGNMGGAMARGFAHSSIVANGDLTVTNRSQEKLDALKAEMPDIHTTTNNNEGCKDADLIILAVKPWQIEDVVFELGSDLMRSSVQIASVAGGISLRQLAIYLKFDADDPYLPLFHIIPNTAISVRAGMTFISSAGANEEQVATVKSLFDELGTAFIINEEQMEACTVLASCGIAFAMRYVRAAVEGGVELGVRSGEAQYIVAQTIKGAAELLMSNGSHPEVEIDKVTTAGGTTIKGLNAMEQEGFTKSVIAGLKASMKAK